jgi:hypothetical protein
MVLSRSLSRILMAFTYFLLFFYVFLLSCFLVLKFPLLHAFLKGMLASLRCKDRNQNHITTQEKIDLKYMYIATKVLGPNFLLASSFLQSMRRIALNWSTSFVISRLFRRHEHWIEKERHSMVHLFGEPSSCSSSGRGGWCITCLTKEGPSRGASPSCGHLVGSVYVN